MLIKFITCSGPNENTNIGGLVEMLEDFPRSEAGIQVCDDKCSYGMPRYEWIMALGKYVRDRNVKVNLALHINKVWVENLANGVVASELEEFLNLEDGNGERLFKRLQLNFKIGREKTPDIDALILVMQKYAEQRFILSYNPSNADLIKQVYSRGVVFDNLFDASFGEGIVPDVREVPIFEDVLQGYAGGLSADNIKSELDKLNLIIDLKREICVDAQGKLEDDNRDFSITKGREFIEKVLEWQVENV